VKAARCGAPRLQVPGAVHTTVLLDDLAVPDSRFHRAVLAQMDLSG